MKNEKIIESWNKIEPNESAKDRMLASIINENSKHNERKENSIPMNKKILYPVAACLMIALFAVGIFNISGNESHNFGLVIANAAENTSEVVDVKSENKYDVKIPYNCAFIIERTDGLSADEQNALFKEMKNKIDSYYKNANGIQTTRVTLSESGKSIYSVYSVDRFGFVFEHPENLDKIVISGKGERSFTKVTNSQMYDEAEIVNEFTISGEEYRAEKNIGISWTPSDKMIEQLENDKEIKISDITDNLIFTAYYNDGTSESIVVDICFNSKGIMKAVCHTK